jgi:integrase
MGNKMQVNNKKYKLKFYLRSPLSVSKTSVLYSIQYCGTRYRGSTGLSIFPVDWNSEEQQPSNKKKRPDLNEVQLYLTYFEKQIDTFLNSNKDLILEEKNKLIEFIKTINYQSYRSNKNNSFWDVFDQFVQHKITEGKSTVMDYDQTLRKHLHLFEINTQIKISLEKFMKNELEFLKLLNKFLEKDTYNKQGGLGLSVNSIGKQLKNIRVFLNWCFDNQLCERFPIKHLEIKQQHKDAIYLTTEELSCLEVLPLISKEKTYRDLFLIGCETGLRFSDFSNLNEAIILQDVIIVRPKKTRSTLSNNELHIPISTRLKQILESYQVIPSLASSKLNEFNLIIRSICQRAGIDSIIQHYQEENGQLTIQPTPKYELVSSHTCRRTFCTLKFLAGMPSHAIMKFSGHTSEANFLRYLRLDAKITAEKYKGFFS